MTARNVVAAVSLGATLAVSLGLLVSGCAAHPAAPDLAGDGATAVHVWDPTGQSPAEIRWQPYPAPPPPGFHWQDTGSPAIQVDPQGRPLPGSLTAKWILVRDGYQMPRMK
jgi:hypothetical protein